MASREEDSGGVNATALLLVVLARSEVEDEQSSERELYLGMGPFDVKSVYLVLLAFKMNTTQAEFKAENFIVVEDQRQEKTKVH